MARIGLKARLSKLEKRRRKPSPNRVLHYSPADLASGPVSADLPVRVIGYWRKGENPASGPLGAFAGRFALIPDFGSAAEWEAAAERQQKELLATARSRTNEPATEAPLLWAPSPKTYPHQRAKARKARVSLNCKTGAPSTAQPANSSNRGLMTRTVQASAHSASQPLQRTTS